MMKLAVIIPAAGGSARFHAARSVELGTPADGGGLGARSKLDEDLAGRTVLQRTIELFSTRPEVACIIVAGPHDPDAMASFRLRHGDMLGLFGAALIPGGQSERWETVAAALREVPEDVTHIAVHDGARPNCPADVIDRVLEAASKHDAVIPVVPVDSTAKRLGAALEDSEPDPFAGILGEQAPSPNRAVVGTVDREGLALAQTPQVFARPVLERAYAQDNLTSTDDAGLVERLGVPIVAVPGDPRNIKITRPLDLEMIRLLAGHRVPGR